MRATLRLLTLTLALTAVLAPAASARVRDPNATAVGLINRFVSDVRDHNVADLNKFLAPEFQIQRADGSRLNKTQYIANLPTLDNPRVDNIIATASGSTLVATYTIASNQTVNGVPYPTTPAPRLSVFERDPKRGWQLVGHGNFNAPTS